VVAPVLKVRAKGDLQPPLSPVLRVCATGALQLGPYLAQEMFCNLKKASAAPLSMFSAHISISLSAIARAARLPYGLL